MDTDVRPPDVMDDEPSTSVLVLVGLLGSLVALLLVAVIVAVGWAAGGDNEANDSRSATAGLPDIEQELGAELWVLDPADSSPATRDDNPVSLQLGDGRLSGLGPCNAYWAQYRLRDDDETLQVRGLRHTTLECSARTMRAEREYFVALRKVRDVDLDDRDHLVLSNSVGDRLTFDGHTTYDELDGTWLVGQVGPGRLEAPVEGTKPILVFDTDSSDLAIATGCNTLRSSWSLFGDRLLTDPAAQTLKHCEEPDGVRAQEAALARILRPGVRINLAPGRLIVLDRFHRILAVATHSGS